MTTDNADKTIIAVLSNKIVEKCLQISLVLAGSILLWINLRGNLNFDDAFMFYRYARHLRDGLGISWNLDGVHTFGETSLLWGVLVWVASFLPLSPERVLLLGSSLSGIGAVIAMASAVVLNAKSAVLKSFTRTLFLIVLPMILNPIFLLNTRTGMETMLAVGINGLFCGFLLIWSRQPAAINAWLVGLTSVAAFLIRPESMLPSLLAIGLASLFLENKQFRANAVFLPACILCAGILVCLVACKLYFHSIVPLAFYVKGRNFYQGYIGLKHPVERALRFFAVFYAFFLLLIWLTKRRQVRMTIVFLIPLLVTTIYLCTLTQIMGGSSRYYLPYCSYVVFPAMIIFDEALVGREHLTIDNPLLRVFLSILLFTAIGGILPSRVVRKLNYWAEGQKIRYAEALRVKDAKVSLPFVEPMRAQRELTDDILIEMPKASTVAATEVGYMGAMAPQMNVIDLSGLNDTEIALHGSSVFAVLERKPDLIWLPHTDYTYLRGLFFDSREFLTSYTIYDDALSFGVALRKDSPYYSQMMIGMKRVWSSEYSGYRMQDYVVKSAIWDRTTSPICDLTPSSF
jgi:hypothetical protein